MTLNIEARAARNSHTYQAPSNAKPPLTLGRRPQPYHICWRASSLALPLSFNLTFSRPTIAYHEHPTMDRLQPSMVPDATAASTTDTGVLGAGGAVTAENQSPSPGSGRSQYIDRSALRIHHPKQD